MFYQLKILHREEVYVHIVRTVRTVRSLVGTFIREIGNSKAMVRIGAGLLKEYKEGKIRLLFFFKVEDLKGTVSPD